MRYYSQLACATGRHHVRRSVRMLVGTRENMCMAIRSRRGKLAEINVSCRKLSRVCRRGERKKRAKEVERVISRHTRKSKRVGCWHLHKVQSAGPGDFQPVWPYLAPFCHSAVTTVSILAAPYAKIYVVLAR